MIEYKFPVEAGHIMMFARAIGDANPVYYDAEYAASTDVGTIIPPPTFTWSSVHYDTDYPLRPKIDQPWFGSGAEPSGVEPAEGDDSGDGGVLHAEQHFEYYCKVAPGDVLTVTTIPGKTWEKQGKRSGKLIFLETITEFRNQAGVLAVTIRTIAVKPEHATQE